MNYKSYLPAYPLLTSDPYISIWSAAEHPAKAPTTHWAGSVKRIEANVTVDGNPYALIGRQFMPVAELTEREVTPCATIFTYQADGVEMSVTFRAPMLLEDMDLMSMPVTYVDFSAKSVDGKEHEVSFNFVWHDDICHDGPKPVPTHGTSYKSGNLKLAWMGSKQQNMLCHTGDHITIDWGYAYMAAEEGVTFEALGGHWGLKFHKDLTVGAEGVVEPFILAYDDVASIQYFGFIAKAWYARKGKTIIQAIHECHDRRAEIYARCDKLDKELVEEAIAAGGESMGIIAAAAYRHTICAHKLIADWDGKPVFLSKENDSNGCIGTVDLSYPSMPLFLLYNPELVRAMCRQIMYFASLPVWQDDFAPHDVGRYPHATGQRYGLKGQVAWDAEKCDPVMNGDCYPPIYLYDGEENIFNLRSQMPVEESGNMILLFAAAMRADGDLEFAREHMDTLRTWVKYLEEYGEDPADQLCTDDFAGHLAHNVNLAFKAVYGLAAFGWMAEKLGNKEEAEYYAKTSKEMAQKVYARAKTDNGTALTLDGQGWSLKYNTIWEKLFNFGLLDEEFFKAELKRYEQEQNEYGVPLDSRRTYTKSDWILWCATMADDAEGVEVFLKPIVKYLKETPTKIAFGDWYDTVSGRYEHFIARSVQGGLYMPLVRKRWEKQ